MYSDPRISARGDVAFIRTSIDKDGDRYRSDIYLLRRGRIQQLTRSGGSVGSLAWSPSGRKLGYVHTEKTSGKPVTTLRILALYGGEPETIVREEGLRIAGPTWLDENTLIISKQIKEAGEGDSKKIRKIRYRMDAEGYFHDRQMHLFRVSTRTRKARQLTSGAYDVTSFDIDRNLARAVFAANMESDAETSVVKHIYEVALGGGTVRRLLEWKGPITTLRLSHDGQRLAFIGHDMAKGISTNTKLYLLPATGASSPEPLTQSLDRSLENSLNTDSRARGVDPSPVWSSDDSRVYYIYTDGQTSRLGYYSFSSGSTGVVDTGELVVEGYDARLGKICFTAMAWDHPAELFSIEEGIGKVERITTEASESVSKFGLKRPEKVRFVASDGVELDGWFLASSAQPTKGTVLEIHGGPRTAYGELFMFEFHYLASSGYNVIFCNPRGSSGYGQDFASAVVGHYGERDYKDIMEFVSYMVSAKSLDGSKLYLTGGSYGGFMTNWIVGHSDIFRAAVTQRSISNWVSFHGTSDIGFTFGPDQIGARPWEDYQKLWDKSPLKYVQNVKTPILIHHAEQDYRCPIEQGEQFFTALRQLGKEAEFVSVPEESHELSRSGKPSRRVSRLKDISGWFDSH